MTSIEQAEESIKEALQDSLSKLEETLILQYEIPANIKRLEKSLQEVKENIGKTELESDSTNPEEDTEKKIEIINQEIITLREIKTKDDYLNKIGKNSHVILIFTNRNNYQSQIGSSLRKVVDEVIFQLVRQKDVISTPKDKAYIMLDTRGGSGEDALEIYDTLNNTFEDPSVIIADEAWSAGTAFSLCCQSVLMVQNALLGPIDSQIFSGNLGHIPAFSYIDGVHRYLNQVVDIISEEAKKRHPSNHLSIKQDVVESNIESLLSPINIHVYGYCFNTLEQITNGVAYRHVKHDSTYGDLSLIQRGIWMNFVESGKMFGHGHGFDSRFLKELSIFDGIPMFLDGYIHEISYEDELLYDLIKSVDKLIERVFYFLEEKNLPTYGLVAHKDLCKVVVDR